MCCAACRACVRTPRSFSFDKDAITSATASFAVDAASAAALSTADATSAAALSVVDVSSV